MTTLLIILWTLAVLVLLLSFPTVAAVFGMTRLFPEGRSWKIDAIGYGWIVIFSLLVHFNPF